jgi:chorismate mutase
MNIFPHPFYIAGPCSAETPEQVLTTARELSQDGRVAYFRAGVWKPRTRPDSFEGNGAPALDWIVQACKETGLKSAVEVATPEHVELCLKAGIDLVWIGARTTVNPFIVQEIADSLKGVEIPVLIKNPINPDVKLWMGAIERIVKAGIHQYGAIHRGFQAYENSNYRYPPKWDLVIELMSKWPDLTVICDPSHITGKRDAVPLVAQKAMDLGMHGLMIETHPTPEKAWSDAVQQITPASFTRLLNELQVRTVNRTDEFFGNELEKLRRIVDSIDEELIELLAKRMRQIEKISRYKKENNITIFQPSRWEDIQTTRNLLGKQLGLDEDFVARILKELHKESIRFQTEIIYPDDEPLNGHSSV